MLVNAGLKARWYNYSLVYRLSLLADIYSII